MCNSVVDVLFWWPMNLRPRDSSAVPVEEKPRPSLRATDKKHVFCLYNKKINLSVTLAGQAVGVKEVEDGIWLVSFMNYDLGYIDLEEKTLQPLENPFGPKV